MFGKSKEEKEKEREKREEEKRLAEEEKKREEEKREEDKRLVEEEKKREEEKREEDKRLAEEKRRLEKEEKKEGQKTKKERIEDLRSRVSKYKPLWDKGGVIQYKDEYCAILHRIWGSQVEFIIAYSDLTKEGYRLMAQDEGKTGGTGSASGGVNSYYYFQKISKDI